MYQGTLETVSNRADWTGTLNIVNDDTGGDIVDLTGVVIKISVRDEGCQVLYAETGDDHFTDLGDGTIQWRFTANEMHKLCRGAYEVGVTVTRDGTTFQLLVATLPVIDGIVR